MYTFLPKTKRGQITVYILVGLVLLIVFGSLFAFVKIARTEKFSDAEQTLTASHQLLLGLFKETITQCLRTAAEESVMSLGFQSGYLFTKQSGPDELINGIDFEHGERPFRVPFGIVRGSPVAAPNYPRSVGADGFRYTTAFLQQNNHRDRIWGDVVLPKLCDMKGPNSPSTNSCHTSTYAHTPNTSIQYKLAFAVSNLAVTCLNGERESLKAILGENEIEPQGVAVLITDSGIKFTLALNATLIQKERATALDEVSYTLPVRLMRVYNLLFFLLDQDTKSVYFDKSADYRNITSCTYPDRIQCWDPEMTVHIIRDPQPDLHPGADIILIEDAGSLNKGEPFFFATAVENRGPMIDYLVSITRNNSDADYDVDINGTLLFQPHAYDPDEDELRIEYRGWKQIGFENSSEFTEGANCGGRPSWCASFVFTELLHDKELLQPTVHDDAGLSDYQPVYVRVGNESLDDDRFCPSNIAGLTVGSCNNALTTCICAANNYCVFNEPKPVECRPGSVCCQELQTNTPSIAPVTLLCDDAECYQSSLSTPIEQTCTNNASCYQYSVNATANQTCTGSQCWQETRKGVAEQKCVGDYCLQETDTGTLRTDCQKTPLLNDQGGSLRRCS